MDSSELAAAVDSIMTENTVKSIFDPVEPLPDSPRTRLTPSPLHFESKTSGLRDESSDEETRLFILKHDGFVPKTSASNSTPRVQLRKTPRLKNAPTCTHLFKKGLKKGETCGNFCKLGEKFCTRHKVAQKKPPEQTFNFETMAVKSKYERLKVSKKYKLLQYVERTVILENGGKILKVRLPKCLTPIPKTGSYLKFEKMGQGLHSKPTWECV